MSNLFSTNLSHGRSNLLQRRPIGTFWRSSERRSVTGFLPSQNAFRQAAGIGLLWKRLGPAHALICDGLRRAFTCSPVKTPEHHRWALMAVYIATGTALCLINLAQADARHLSDFLCYLACAIIAVLGLRLTTRRTAIPAGFLVMLLALQDLSLPELLFIACVISVLGQFQESGRSLPSGHALVFSIASGTIGMAAAQVVHQAVGLLKSNALFPAPFIASSLVLLLNWGLARTLTRDRSVSVTEV